MVEGAQGGDVVGATKEAVTAAAKARGRGNGWGDNRTSCRSYWQKVLVVLLVWLVVPAQAAGAAQAARGVATAATADEVGAGGC